MTDLAETLTSLREVMAQERRAIARLDTAAIEGLTARKHALVAALRVVPKPLDPALALLVSTIRVELGANAALIAAAAEAVAAALGVEPSSSYDRTARALVTTRPLRVIAY